MHYPRHEALILVLFALAACGPSPSQPETVKPLAPASAAPIPAPAASPAAATSAAASASAAGKVDAPAPKPLEPLERPSSMYTIGGWSLSDVPSDVLLESLKKLGYREGPEPLLSTQIGGVWEAVTVGIQKGDVEIVFSLARPTKTPIPAVAPYTDETFSPRVNAEQASENGALVVLFDDKADVAIVLHVGESSKAPKGKALLKALVSQSKR